MVRLADLVDVKFYSTLMKLNHFFAYMITVFSGTIALLTCFISNINWNQNYLQILNGQKMTVTKFCFNLNQIRVPVRFTQVLQYNRIF